MPAKARDYAFLPLAMFHHERRPGMRVCRHSVPVRDHRWQRTEIVSTTKHIIIAQNISKAYVKLQDCFGIVE